MGEPVDRRHDGAPSGVAALPRSEAAGAARPAPAMSADLYRTLLDNMTEGVSLTAEDGTIVYTNPAEDRIFGYGPGELVGQHVSVQNAYPDEENQRRVGEVIEHLKTRGSWEGEWLNRRKDGTVFITASRISAVEVDGRPHWLCVQRDVTLSRQADERLRAIFENAGVGMLAMGLDCRIRRANAAYGRIVCRSPAELVGLSCLDFTHPDDVEANRQALAELERDGGAAFEKRYVVAGGRVVSVRITLSRLDGDGVLAIVEDVSARAQAEQALRRRSEQLQALADATLTITQASTLEATLDEITRTARRIIGAHQGVVSLTRGPDWSQAINAVELTDKHAAWRDYATMPDGSGIYAWLCEGNRPVRLTQAELEAHPRWRGFGPHAVEHPPMRGWLVAPLVGRDGRNLGLIQLSDKEDGSEFDEADEAMLVQLAQLASAAVEQAQTEAALRESEGRFRLMADAVPQIVWITDAEGRTEFFNKHWSDYTGVPFEPSTAGEVAASFVHPEDAGPTMAAFEAARAAERTFFVEHRIRSKAGVYRWFLVRAEPYRDPQTGQVVRWFGASVDIHDRKEAEAALQDSERRLRAAILASPFPTMLHAEDGEVLELSRKWTELTGYGRDEIRTHHDWARLAYPDSAEVFDEQIAEEFAGEGEVAAGEWEVRTKDGATRVWDFYNVGVGRLPDGRKLQISAAADVTERKAAEAALRLRGEEFETLADNIPTLCWMAYADGHIYWYNRRWYDYTGASPESQMGWGWESLHDPEVLPKVAERWRRSIATGEPFEMTFPLKGADGVFRPFLTRIVPIRDEGGRITRWFGTNVDITEQVEAERLLERRVAERTAERDRTWRVSRDLLVVAEPDGKLAAVNQAWTAVLGWEEHELVGATFMEFAHPDDVAPTLAKFEETFTTPLVEPYEYRLRHKDGTYRWLAWTAAFEDGRVFANGRDVTAERARQAELAALEAARREADALYRAYFENTAEALFVVNVLEDGGFTIEDLNPAHQSSIGLLLAEVQGKRIDEVLPPELAEPVIAHYRAAIAAEGVYQYREAFEFHGRTTYWDTVLVPVRDSAGRIVRLIGSSRDLTAQVAAEEQLRQSQKMEAMGQLTGGVAHDFNNLLTPIVGSLDMLMRRGLGNEREQRLIGGAMQSAERAKTLVQRLLAFARRQPLQATAVDLPQLVAGMAGLIGSTLGPNVDVRVELADDLPPARADANQLEMALLNLAVNARDAMPDGGVLTISAARESVRAGHRSKLKQGRYVRLSVTDTGTGMDAQTLARAIEPFFSTKGIGKGTGLGLSMVHGLAAQLGGGVTLTSELGRGTTVDLWLPISAEPLVDGDERPTASAPKARGRALLVDDEELVRMSTADMLADLGYDVVEAGSAEEALRLLKQAAPPDLLVTDHLMPGMSGADLAREARLLKPDLPILIVSGYAEVEGIAPDLPRLTKPFRNAELAGRLSALLPAGTVTG